MSRSQIVRVSDFASRITFGEAGWFGGLAPFSCAREGHENRAVTEGKFFHSPRGGSCALDFTKSAQEPNGITDQSIQN
jgi:hypothetical protein